jgi:hypothetical protein
VSGLFFSGKSENKPDTFSENKPDTFLIRRMLEGQNAF